MLLEGDSRLAERGSGLWADRDDAAPEDDRQVLIFMHNVQ